MAQRCDSICPRITTSFSLTRGKPSPLCISITLHTTLGQHGDCSTADTSVACFRFRRLPSSGSSVATESEPIFERENATLVFLSRNSELKGVLSSMRSLENRFNRKYQYPWVFLNDEDRVMLETSAPVHFGLIPKEHWEQPAWVDKGKADESRKRLKEQNIIYGGKNMCRFNSGFFFHHPLLQQFKPDVQYFCDMKDDPFQFMINENQTYGFTIALYESPETVTTLWESVKEFMALYPQYIAKDNAMEFLSSDGGKTYNMCHFWSNFEIADMDFWRSEAYQNRWGDAPVHSIAAALFLPKDKLHFFRDIGYRHAEYQHCPSGKESLGNSCSCNRWNSIGEESSCCTGMFLTRQM
ncbi:glycosyl transferase [Gymnopus androsaceus JB14]|uniref:Glycosyl transferase n=1 Tax=Gymnopus androsaceus JB14 TaxID=1447944 RepID=A0A6A4GWH6_9AGAR|nr:glycosyl transferase [Gymnopus androsaceus JB14]